MSNVLTQVLLQTAQWSWVKKSKTKSAFGLIGGKCYLQHQENILRALQHDMILELMATHRISILNSDELKSTLKLLSPFLPNQTDESIDKDVNNSTMRSIMFWLAMNNCLHQILIKSDNKAQVNFMEQTHRYNLSAQELDWIRELANKISLILDPLFCNLPTVNELKESWCRDFAKSKKNNIDIIYAITLTCFIAYSIVVDFQYYSYPIPSALFCVEFLFSTFYLIQVCLWVKGVSFSEIYFKKFIKNFSKELKQSVVYQY